MKAGMAKVSEWLSKNRSAFWRFSKPILLHPLSYVLFLGFFGSALIVTGVALYFGLAAAFVAAGGFMILGARYVSKGMRNG